MLNKETNQTIIRKATEIVMKLRDKDFIYYDDTDGFREWVARAAAMVFAYYYGHEEYDNEEDFFKEWVLTYDGKNIDILRDHIERAREVFEYYDGYNTDNLWVLTAYLWHNEVGFEYAMSVYEQYALDDPYYMEMGSIIKDVIFHSNNIINESNLDALWHNVKTYRQSDKYKAVLNACVRFRHLAPYNAMLVEIQRPSARYVLTEKEWKTKYDRGIKPNARPIIILVPFGPVDFLFEISDTYPLNSTLFSRTENDILEEIAAPYETKNDVSDRQLYHLIERLSIHGIAIDLAFIAGASYSARIELLKSNSHTITIPIGRKYEVKWKADYLLSVNKNAQNGEKFASICHELGHLFCSHLNAPRNWKKWEVRHIPYSAKEFEAESVSWLICELLGIDNPSERYLSNYLSSNGEIPSEVSIERILSATKIIEDICSTNKKTNYKDGLLYKNCEDFRKHLKYE